MIEDRVRRPNSCPCEVLLRNVYSAGESARGAPPEPPLSVRGIRLSQIAAFTVSVRHEKEENQIELGDLEAKLRMHREEIERLARLDTVRFEFSCQIFVKISRKSEKMKQNSVSSGYSCQNHRKCSTSSVT